MNARNSLGCRGFQRHIACSLAVAVLLLGTAGRVTAQPTRYGVAMTRIVTEIRELRRLVFHLKRDESKARSQRDQITKYRNNAVHFGQGGRNVLYRTGFAALLRTYEQSPGQVSLLQVQVPSLPADNFVPEPDDEFTGGDVSVLLEFCRTRNLSLRYGGRAQLVIAELSRDMVHQADARIAELDDKIEHFKAQNIAHTDLVGKLMLCATHCGHCHGCYHYGYGYCGYVTPLVLDHPLAGLGSKAYDTYRTGASQPVRETEIAVTDHRRLKFLTPDAPSENQLSGIADHVAKADKRQRHSLDPYDPSRH